ncbi:MAG: hypothetical protein WBD31_28625 [Rubripirellula sp.]
MKYFFAGWLFDERIRWLADLNLMQLRIIFKKAAGVIEFINSRNAPDLYIDHERAAPVLNFLGRLCEA